MALILADRVKETTATTGTGTLTLGGATPGFQTFGNGIGNANTTYYTILDSNNPPTFWEVGLGTYSSAANTLSRDSVYSSSNGNALVNLPAGVKFVFGDYPAGQALYESKLVAGTGITITKSVPNNTLTIAATGTPVTVYGDFTTTTTGLASAPWFNYPAAFSFSNALVNAQTAAASPVPNYTVVSSSGGVNLSGTTAVPTSNQNVNLPALVSPTYPVTLTLTVNATMNNSDGTTTPKTKTSLATYFLPGFSKVSSNSANPNFTTSDTAGTQQYASGQTFSQAITAPTQYFWIATPVAATSFFVVTFGNFPVSITPDATFSNQIIGGIGGWNVYGFTNLTSLTQIIQVI